MGVLFILSLFLMGWAVGNHLQGVTSSNNILNVNNSNGNIVQQINGDVLDDHMVQPVDPHDPNASPWLYGYDRWQYKLRKICLTIILGNGDFFDESNPKYPNSILTLDRPWDIHFTDG